MTLGGRLLPVIIAMTTAAVTAAITPTAARSAGQGESPEAVKFTLQSRIDGTAAPFLVAIDKGFYKAEGLDVAVDPAADTAEAIKRVASGLYDMGFADLNAMIKFRDTNPATPVKAVFVLYNKPQYAVLARRSRGIAEPKDLEGKKLGAPAAALTLAYLPIFAQANGVDMKKVIVENVGIPVREPVLAAGEVDAIAGSSLISYIALKERGAPVDDILPMLMADYGVELYGAAIIVNGKLAADEPEIVRAFLRGFVKGLKDTIKNPAPALDSVLKRAGGKRGIELERLRLSIRDNILTPEVKANGYGGIDSARFDRALSQLASVHAFKTKPAQDDVFDASFLPTPQERRAP